MNALFEILRELDLIEEDPRIVVLVIESILEFPDALDRSIDLFVPTEDQEDRVGLSELRVKGSGVDLYHLYGFSFLLILAVEKIRHRGLLAV